jgi:hypothetical protein
LTLHSPIEALRLGSLTRGVTAPLWTIGIVRQSSLRTSELRYRSLDDGERVQA